jgi:hypothetical protein
VTGLSVHLRSCAKSRLGIFPTPEPAILASPLEDRVSLLLRRNAALGSLVKRHACLRSEQPRSPSPQAPDHDSMARVLMSSATLGVILLAGHRRLDLLLEAVAAWGEAQDLTWIE